MPMYKAESTVVHAYQLEENAGIFDGRQFQTVQHVRYADGETVPGKVGDWVVTGPNGYKTVIANEIFRELFTLVTNGE